MLRIRTVLKAGKGSRALTVDEMLGAILGYEHQGRAAKLYLVRILAESPSHTVIQNIPSVNDVSASRISIGEAANP